LGSSPHQARATGIKQAHSDQDNVRVRLML
jgi:hypothetical protein